MREMLLYRFVVAGTGLIRNWWQNRYKVRKTLSANLIQHSQESSSRELFVGTSSSFAPASPRPPTTAAGQMFHKRSNKRWFGRFTNGTWIGDAELVEVKKISVCKKDNNICSDGHKPYKRSRTLCCGLSSERLDVEEGNSTRISKLAEKFEADEAHVMAGKPSKGCYKEFCNLINLNNSVFFPRKEQKRISVQSKVGETSACFSDSILLDPVDVEHLEPLRRPLTSEPCPRRKRHSNAEKHFKLQLPKDTFQETVPDKDGDQTNRIHMLEDSSDICAVDEQNCSQVESNLQLRSKEPITIMSPMPLPEQSFVKAENLRGETGSVAKLEVAQEGCQQYNNLNVPTETDNNDSPMEIETIIGPAKLPNLISETENGVSITDSRCDADTSSSSVTQNHCLLQAFLQTEKTSYEYPAIVCNHKNSCQILAGNKDSIINPQLLSSTEPLSITKVYDGFSFTAKKLLDPFYKKREFRTAKKSYVNNRVHLDRKRRLRTPFKSKTLQLHSRQEKVSKTDEGYRMQSDIPYTENPCEVNVNRQDKQLLLSSHGKKRKLEALFETFSSSSSTVQLATSMQIQKSKISDVMPDKEHMLFRFGIEAGYMLMLPSTSTKIQQLNRSLENSKNLVAELRNKHDSNWCLVPNMLIVQQQINEKPCVPETSRKHQSSSRASDSKSEETCRHLDDYEVRDEDSSSDVSVLTIDRTKHKTDLAELEKELEAELELMELNIIGGNLSGNKRRLSGLSNLEADGTAAILHQSETPDYVSQSPDSFKSNHDVDSKPNTCKHVVSSTLLDKEFLQCTAEERQRARILDLEVQVSMAKKLINSREREILWWKDCALHLTKHQFLPNTENAPEKVLAAVVEETKKQVPDTNCPSLDTSLKGVSPDAVFPSETDFLSVDFSENSGRDGMDYRLTKWLYTPDSMETFQGAINLAHNDNEMLDDLGSVEKDLCLNKGDCHNRATCVLKGCDMTCKIKNYKSSHQKKLAIENDISIMWDEDSESDHSCVSIC